MDKFKGQSILNFIKELPNDEACKAYLAKIKWHDGFTCSKCGGTKGCEKSDYRYHCYTCDHVEVIKKISLVEESSCTKIRMISLRNQQEMRVVELKVIVFIIYNF